MPVHYYCITFFRRCKRIYKNYPLNFLTFFGFCASVHTALLTFWHFRGKICKKESKKRWHFERDYPNFAASQG